MASHSGLGVSQQASHSGLTVSDPFELHDYYDMTLKLEGVQSAHELGLAGCCQKMIRKQFQPVGRMSWD